MNAIVAGSALGALGVVLGAFGAHALKDRLTTEQLVIWETGVRYQFVHALALLATGLLARQTGTELRSAAHAFVWGTVVFSGTLYALALGGPRWLGAITPLGGMLFIAGWVLLALGARGF